MRILVYFKARVLEDRGTPLRCRNLVYTLSKRSDMVVKLLSSDETKTLHAVAPYVDHQYMADQKDKKQYLEACVEQFGPDIIYGQTNKALYHLSGLRFSNGHRPKLVADLHGDRALERFENYDRPVWWRVAAFLRARLNEKIHFRQMDGFTVVSNALAERVRPLNQPVKILWGGVDTDQFRPKDDGATSNRIRVAYAGNYRPYQGVPVLLEAGRRLLEANEPFHFTLIGNIDQFPDVKQQAINGLGEHVNLAGQIPYEQVSELLKEADILVVPRSSGLAAGYNYPSKLSEYLALGKPVVATDVGETRRVIQHMKTGLIVEPKSAEAMANALRLLKDEGVRKQLGNGGRRFAETHLTWSVVGDRLSSFFDEILTL